MIPRDFPEQNGELGPPKGQTVDECHVLPVFRDGEVVISCWQPTDEERELIAQGGAVYLSIAGRTMPPAALQATNPFGGEPARVEVLKGGGASS